MKGNRMEVIDEALKEEEGWINPLNAELNLICWHY
jgi:hypothetical protein